MIKSKLGILLALCVSSSAVYPALANEIALSSLTTDQPLADFYQPTANWQQHQPGEMLKTAPLPHQLMIDNAAQAMRILYTSTNGINPQQKTPVSGVVYLPAGKPPADGWPVMAWAHGTRGVADQCAPSWSPRSPDRQRYLSRWLKAGFAVVASDYQGLGTAGPHPYLLYKPEGYSILDGVKASLHAVPELANKVIIVGQSQGGGAALGASWLAPHYAPKLNILGTVATGAAATTFADTHDAPQIKFTETLEDSPEGSAYEALFLLGTIKSLQPDTPLEDYVTKPGYPIVKAAAHQCFHAAIDVAKAQQLRPSEFYQGDISQLDKLLAEHGKLPNASFESPIFVGTGLLDNAVDTRKQFNNFAAMCSSGSVVEGHFYPEQDHLSTVNYSFKDALAFAQQLLVGKAIHGNCNQQAQFKAQVLKAKHSS